MIEINEYAYQILFETLSSNLDKSTNYGSPPIFDWFCRVLDETRDIESFRYLRRGEYKYKLGYSLGIAYVTCEYVGRKRFLIVTNYDINENVLFSWQNEPNDCGMLPKEKMPQPQLDYRICQSQNTLFGYKYVQHKKTKLYNLIDNNNKLVAQWWFSAIKPINQSKPYSKYQIIAYINVNGVFCALGYDGRVYNLGRFWKNMVTEHKDILNTQLFMNIITENIDSTMNTNKKVIRLTESKLMNIIEESVRKVLKEQSPSFENRCLDYLVKKEFSQDAVKKVANMMYKNDCWVLKDGGREILCLATNQNGDLMYSLNQRGWVIVK